MDHAYLRNFIEILRDRSYITTDATRHRDLRMRIDAQCQALETKLDELEAQCDVAEAMFIENQTDIFILETP